MSEYKVTGTLRAKFIKNKNRLEIKTIGWDWNDYAQAKVCYISYDNMQIIFPEFSFDAQMGHLYIEHMALPQMEQRLRLKWKLCIQFVDEEGNLSYKRFGNNNIARKIKSIVDDSESQAFRFGSSIYEFCKNGKSYVVLPYYAVSGRMGFCVRLKYKALINIVKARITSLSIEGSVLTIRASVKKEGYRPYRMVLIFRNEKETEACEYVMDTQMERLESGRYRIQAQIDLAKICLKPIYWDAMLTMVAEDAEESDQEKTIYYVNMYNTTQAFKDQFLRLRQEVAYRTKDGNIFFPFVTKKDTLGFKYREVSKADSKWFRLKERIARKIYQANPQYWDSRNIYLVYEKYCMGAQDNGYYFFRYCMQHKDKAEQDARFYYVIDRSSKERKKVAQYGMRVIDFLSIRHMVYLQAAKLLVSTDSKAHAYAWRQKGSILYDALEHKKNVFLQHGVIGLKNITKLYCKNSKTGCNLFIASSKKEKEIIHEKLKYRNNEIAVTGLARWDGLKDKSTDKKEILVMPTWRSWLDSISSEDFSNSDYFKSYEAMLTNESLNRLLEEKDLYVTFYLHPILRKYIHDFYVKSSRIRLVAVGEEPLNEIIMRCRLMITDYSSASWDMFYLKKPVVFYQFDEEEYNKVHGSYMDFETDLFGDRVRTLNELVDCLRDTVERNFTLKQEHLAKWDKAFEYVDSNNSKRILEQIKKRDWDNMDS